MGEGPAEHPSPGGRASGCHAPRAVARGAGLLAAGAGCVGCARALSTIGRASGACRVSCSRITVPAWCWPSLAGPVWCAPATEVPRTGGRRFDFRDCFVAVQRRASAVLRARKTVGCGFGPADRAGGSYTMLEGLHYASVC